MRGKLHAAAGVAAAMALGTGTAQAQGNYGDFGLDLGTLQPGSEAKPTFIVAYRNPDDPNGKPPAIARAVFRLPPGTRINTAAVERCTATDEEIRAQGPAAACPPGSKVGSGTLTAVTGFGPPTDPVAGEVTVFNGPDQLIEVVTVPGTQTVAGMDRLTIDGNVLTAHPPATPGGPPDGRTAVKDIQLKIDRGGYITAPAECGSAGWGYSAHYEFANGATHDVWHALECARQPVSSNVMSIQARPNRIRAGRRTRVRFVVRSPSAACRRGAKVRFAGKRAITAANGRATIAVRVRRAGRHPMNVSKRGCRTARGVVVVRR